MYGTDPPTGTHGGRRIGAGRPRHPLGIGVKTSVMIPARLHAAIQAEADEQGVKFSRALVDRLIRGGRLSGG